MNKFNKGKLIGIVAASLSAVSLMSVGFATWIIGVQKTEGDTSISITADDVKYKSLIVSATFTNHLILRETSDKPATNVNKNFTYEGDKGDLTIDVTFTFVIGKDYTADAFDSAYNKITFDFATDTTVNNTVASKDVHTRTTGTEGLTYFELPNAISTGITYDALQFKKESTDDITLKATLTTTIGFKWGSLFGNNGAESGIGTSPMTYYNNTIDSITNENEKVQYMQNAYKELDAMHTKYTNPENQQLKLKFSLTK